MKQWLAKISKAEPHEFSAALWSFAYFFCILAAYYVIRPIREEMGIQVGQQGLSELFTAVFVSLLLVVPVFGWLTSKFSRVQFLPWLYGFFALNLFGFWLWLHSVGVNDYWFPRVFYVWVSVFNLFAVSVFWSFMADVFRSDQAKRLFGFIAAGGTAGALVGPLITSALVKTLGTANMLWFSIGFLLLCIIGVKKVSLWYQQHPKDDTSAVSAKRLEEGLGGNPFAGITDVLKSPYLLGICAFLFLFALLSTTLYFQSNEMMKAAFPESARRVQVFAWVDATVNAITLLFQLFAFGAVITKMGTRRMLCAMPLLSVFGFVAMAVAPVISTLLVFGVLRRAGEYAITKPTRETLFTVVPDEQKYKAKNVIDTLVHRTGDVTSSWIFKGVKGTGMDFTAVSWLAVPVSLVWLAVAWWLGGKHTRMEGDK